jgi:Cu(I)/Ag(I) efflux system membrane fusion protein
MDLIPVEEGSGGADEEAPNRVTLTKRAKALARITTEEVRRAASEAVELRLLGRVEYDERRVRTVTSWTTGRIDRLQVAVTGQRIGRGQVIATLYSPEIYSAQQDLIQAAKQVKRLSNGTPTALRAAEAALESTRQRLRLLGVPDNELTKMERAERPFQHVPIRANAGGTVIERLVDEGAYVNPGTGIYRVADLSNVWVQLDAYERDLAMVSRGQKVALSISAFPEETFEGTVAFIDPVLDRRTRTSQVRVEVSNRDRRLQPGMFAEALIEGGNGEQGLKQLVIPESAPLFTGRRSVVYVEVPDSKRPTYEAREVRLGHKTGDVYPVIVGLQEGERVVVNGAFTLDADLQIRGGRSMMAQPDDSEPSSLDRVVQADPEFMASLEPVLGSYLSVQERLGEDDFEAAKTAMRALEREVGRVQPPSSSEAREAWTSISEGLLQHVTEGAESDDIEAARVIFEQLSHQIRSLLERFGNPLSSPLRLAFCPMAMNNRGAEWIQRGEQIDNSYFGAAMRRCGEVRATVEPGGHLPASSTEGRESSGAANARQGSSQ